MNTMMRPMNPPSFQPVAPALWLPPMGLSLYIVSHTYSHIRCFKSQIQKWRRSSLRQQGLPFPKSKLDKREPDDPSPYCNTPIIVILVVLPLGRHGWECVNEGNASGDVKNRMIELGIRMTPL